MKARSAAIVRALLVTFLWSTSWLLIRIGLEDIPPLTFAALRYTIAAAVLWVILLSTGRSREVRAVPRRFYSRLALLGIVFYSITQTSQFVALNHLPATTLSLILTFSTVIAAIMARASLGERTRFRQWIGVASYVMAAAVFLGIGLDVGGSGHGFVAAIVGVIANAWAGVLGRGVNRTQEVSSIVVTAVSMTVGSVVMVGIAMTVDGFPTLSPRAWAILVWLATVNTAFAFVLWNKAQQNLGAVEMSIINSTMLFQISILAVLFLNEGLTLVQWGMIGIGGIGALIVQLPTTSAVKEPGRHMSGEDPSGNAGR